MLRGENIVCGTSTTGTGTLTLAAVPVAVGGVDFNAWLKSTGIGFVSGNAILVSYTIIEYTDATFAKPKFVEKGVGTLTLGAALVNATLARTTVQTVSNANADTYQVGGGATAITIGTAANTLVFVGASAADIPAWSPYYENSGTNDGLGVPPVWAGLGSGNSAGLLTAQDYYQPFEWRLPMLVKKASVRVSTAYATGAPVSNAYMRLYAINSSGQPGKLLIDFGLLGAANTSLNSVGNKSSALHASGFFLTPGHYFADFISIFSGGSTTPTLVSSSSSVNFATGILGTTQLLPNVMASATGGTGTPAPDPANVTGYAVSTPSANQHFFFALSPS